MKIAEAQDATIDKTPPPWERPYDQPGFPREERKLSGGACASSTSASTKRRMRPTSQPPIFSNPAAAGTTCLVDSSFVNGVELARLSTSDYAHYQDTRVNWRPIELWLGHRRRGLGPRQSSALS